MIYAASLALFTKKAMGDKCHQSNINHIIDNMTIDPEASTMEVVILSARDLEGPFRARVQNAINSKHPSICVIYLYTNDKEKALLSCAYSKYYKRIKDDSIKEAVEEFYGDHVTKTKKLSISSKDDQVYIEPEAPLATQVVEEYVPPIQLAETPEEKEVDPIQLDIDPIPDYSLIPNKAVKETAEEKIRAINNYHDWEYFKKAMDNDCITRQLIEENTGYQGLLNMLDVWDIKIRDVFHDKSLGRTEKFNKIKEFGLQRSILKASENHISVSKLISIMEAIIESASRTVDEQVDSYKEAIFKLAIDKKAVMEGLDLQPILQKRLDIQLELMQMLGTLIATYKAIDQTVSEKISMLAVDLPSSNQFISEMLAPVKQLFLPTNSASLATLMMQSLQSGRVTVFALEDKINNIIGLIFKLAAADEEVIAYQQNIINLLKAQRVEDIVIRDSLIKETLRIFVGVDDTGRTTTALTWAGMMSRRFNTLVVDLTENTKLPNYGVECMSLEEFMVERRERQLLCVTGSVGHDPEKAFQLMTELKNRISYYPNIIIVLDDTQQDLLNQFSEDALTVHYITDCSDRSLRRMKPVIENHTTENIAHRLVVIDNPVNVLEVASTLGVDMTTTKLVTLPYMREMKACTIRGTSPHETKFILDIFEEAFR